MESQGLLEKKRRHEEADESQNKLLKVEDEKAPNKFEAIRKQILYYFSDKNLCRDKFFHEKISESPEIQGLTERVEDIMTALEDVSETTNLETKMDDQKNIFIRRKTPLPELKQQKFKDQHSASKKLKSIPSHEANIHRLGVLMIVTKVPKEVTWLKIKEALQTLLKDELRSETAKIRHVSDANAEGEAFVYMKKFPDDQENLKKIESLLVDNIKLEIKLVDNLATARRIIEQLPANVSRDREKEFSRYKMDLRRKPLLIADTRFASIEHLRKCYHELLSKTEVDKVLEPPSLDVIKALLQYHPRASEKMKDFTGIKIGVRQDLPTTLRGPAKCFFVQRSDGTCEVRRRARFGRPTLHREANEASREILFVQDFSILKCLDRMMEDPPVVA